MRVCVVIKTFGTFASRGVFRRRLLPGNARNPIRKTDRTRSRDPLVTSDVNRSCPRTRARDSRHLWGGGRGGMNQRREDVVPRSSCVIEKRNSNRSFTRVTVYSRRLPRHKLGTTDRGIVITAFFHIYIYYIFFFLRLFQQNAYCAYSSVLYDLARVSLGTRTKPYKRFLRNENDPGFVFDSWTINRIQTLSRTRARYLLHLRHLTACVRAFFPVKH